MSINTLSSSSSSSSPPPLPPAAAAYLTSITIYNEHVAAAADNCSVLAQ